MTTTINITDTVIKVRNYQGNNSFLLKMKETIQKYNGLTIKQAEAAEKCLNSQVKTIDMENLPEDLKRIMDYKGENNFVKDIQTKFTKYGTLTAKQVEASIKQIQKEEDKARTVAVRIPTPGETILLGRRIGQDLKEQYNLEFNPMIIDITKVLGVSPKAIKFAGKMTIKRGSVCMCCGRTLTDEFSMLTKLGKTCAGHMKIEYITDASQAERLRNDYLKRVEEIGVMEFWVPKKQIKMWSDDMTQRMLETMI
jgi:hypothetical protein